MHLHSLRQRKTAEIFELAYPRRSNMFRASRYTAQLSSSVLYLSDQSMNWETQIGVDAKISFHIC